MKLATRWRFPGALVREQPVDVGFEGIDRRKSQRHGAILSQLALLATQLRARGRRERRQVLLEPRLKIDDHLGTVSGGGVCRVLSPGREPRSSDHPGQHHSDRQPVASQQLQCRVQPSPAIAVVCKCDDVLRHGGPQGPVAAEDADNTLALQGKAEHQAVPVADGHDQRSMTRCFNLLAPAHRDPVEIDIGRRIAGALIEAPPLGLDRHQLRECRDALCVKLPHALHARLGTR